MLRKDDALVAWKRDRLGLIRSPLVYVVEAQARNRDDDGLHVHERQRHGEVWAVYTRARIVGRDRVALNIVWSGVRLVGTQVQWLYTPIEP